eukprot:3772098-Prymnesium_polylepis.1
MLSSRDATTGSTSRCPRSLSRPSPTLRAARRSGPSAPSASSRTRPRSEVGPSQKTQKTQITRFRPCVEIHAVGGAERQVCAGGLRVAATGWTGDRRRVWRGGVCAAPAGPDWASA